MAQYGQILDSRIDIKKINVYDLFSAYFNNPKMEKISDVDEFTMYGCKVNSLVRREKKYILVLVKRGIYHQVSMRLADIEWIFLQTRTLEEDYNVPTHSYSNQSHLAPIPIKLVRKSENKTIYSCSEFPITVSLLFSKHQIRPYSDNGTLMLALENYNTIISFQ